MPKKRKNWCLLIIRYNFKWLIIIRTKRKGVFSEEMKCNCYSSVKLHICKSYTIMDILPIDEKMGIGYACCLTMAYSRHAGVHP